ncbi:factor of DNA methylation 5-like [Helianthus annuus]|uniref:factor of DNA methylation 5-like n=1 Tax=Helianthus annuus TaxID=4232 RepID=UPI0016530E3D|nr:factor of DNA methylation 5-like [Helianthus annuus]
MPICVEFHCYKVEILLTWKYCSSSVRRKLQVLEQERVNALLDERERAHADVDKLRKEHELRSKEVSKQVARTEREKQRLDKEKRKIDMGKSSLNMASIEQKKGDEDLLRLIEEQRVIYNFA